MEVKRIFFCWNIEKLLLKNMNKDPHSPFWNRGSSSNYYPQLTECPVCEYPYFHFKIILTAYQFIITLLHRLSSMNHKTKSKNTNENVKSIRNVIVLNKPSKE